MKEVPDQRILAELARETASSLTQSSQPGDPNNLGILADQLSRIAEELRRGTSFGLGERSDTGRMAGSTFSSGQAPKPHTHSFGFLDVSGNPDSGFPHRHTRTVVEEGHVRKHLNSPSEVRAHNLSLARRIYASRRQRGVIFGNEELFGEPAWDILLDLYIAQAEGKTVSVSSACIGSAAPPTTGLRWLGVLAEQGLVLREHDPDDQRRVLVRLTEKGTEAMDAYFSATEAA